MRLHHALDGPQVVTDEDRLQPLEERWACQSGANDLWGWVVSELHRTMHTRSLPVYRCTILIRHGSRSQQSKDAVARACLASVTLPASDVFANAAHEVFYLVAPTTKADGDERAASRELARLCCAESQIRPGWFEQGGPYRGFYDTSKAERLLSWVHE